MRYLSLVILLLSSSILFSQEELSQKQEELRSVQQKEATLLREIEVLKLQNSVHLMKKAGYPTHTDELDIVEHSGLVLGFNCAYKMSAWTFHILSPDIKNGAISRTNDFRTDDKTSCESAVEADYFLKMKNEDGTFDYDGFGFDRGHLAPSADFRWSEVALSESYYYSNMTPQRKGFNPESWAELERLLRTITIKEDKALYILTGPILHDSLAIIERSVNKLRIPDYHYKIIADLSTENPRGMAFLMPNKKLNGRLSEYVVSIDSIEAITGLDFFSELDAAFAEKIESSSGYSQWEAQQNTIDVEPLNALELPKGIFNTRQAESKVGKKVSIVGKVVSTKFIAKSQSTFLNLDQSFPNQIFSIRIWKDGRRNFSYKPEEALEGKYIVVTGTVTLDKNGIPRITVNKEGQIEMWDGKQ